MDAAKNRLLKKSYRFCDRVTRQASSTFYLAAWLFDSSTRRDLFAVYAFCRIADDLADAPGLTLDERRRELQQLRRILKTHDYDDTDQQWPAFFDVVDRYGIPVKYFEELLDGVARDLTLPVAIRDMAELEVYSYQVAGVVGVTCAYILVGMADTPGKNAVPNKAVLAGAKRLGIAMQITNIMRDISADLDIRRVYLPATMLERYGVTHDQLRAGELTPGFVQLMGDLAARATEHYQAARQAIPLLAPRNRWPTRSAMNLYWKILRRIEHKHFNVYNVRVRLSTPAKLWVVLRSRSSNY